MCGIFGTYGFTDPDLMAAMAKKLVHRGPDESGEHGSEQVWLGHRRLSIIDLISGNQPIHNEDRTLWTTYNGEIYNFLALKEDLVNRGHRFYTESDTEVLVHAYEEYGSDAFAMLNGIFAAALWDEKARRLILVRDRLGVKPIYYFEDGGKFVFASELQALLQYQGIDRQRLNPDKIAEYMVFRHTSSPETVISGVKKLPPGTYLTIENGESKVRPYWAFRPAPEPMDLEEAAREFLSCLRRAVHGQLIADVPIGVLLSGGIDSSAIVALASEARERINTFAIQFQNDPKTELPAARLVAERFGTDHRELTVQPADLEIIPDVIRRNDEPVAGPSSFAYYRMLEKMKGEGIKVVLLGHGADEIAGGYEHPRILAKLARVRDNPLSAALVNGGLAAATALFPRDRCFARSRRLFRDGRDIDAAYLALYAVFDPTELSSLFDVGFEGRVDFKPLSPFMDRGLELGDAISAYEMGPWLADDLLHRVDRMCMAHSIEGRVPFLDNELVEMSGRIPFSLKVQGGREKAILKKAMKGLLPDATLRRRKQRFTTPIDHFFGPRFLDICRRLFEEENPLNETVFNREFLLQLLEFQRAPSYRFGLRFHRLLSQFYSRQIWTVFTLHLWHKIVVENQDCAYLFEGNMEEAA